MESDFAMKRIPKYLPDNKKITAAIKKVFGLNANEFKIFKWNFQKEISAIWPPYWYINVELEDLIQTSLSLKSFQELASLLGAQDICVSNIHTTYNLGDSYPLEKDQLFITISLEFAKK